MDRIDMLLAKTETSLYGTPRRRTVFFKTLTAVLSANMLITCAGPAFAGTGNLPGATSNGTTPQPNYTISGNTGTFTGGGTWTWENAASLGFAIANGYTVSAPDGGKFIDRSGSVSSINGILSAPGRNVYLINPSGITLGSGATINVGGLVAAAMNGFSFGTTYGAGDVSGNVDAGGKGGSVFTVLVGQNVSGAPAGARILATAGMGEGSTFTLASADNGATITFAGTTGEGTKLSAENISLGGSTIAGGSVSADVIKGVLTQTAGELAARGTSGLKFENAVTQNGGTIDAGSQTLTLSEGGTLGGTITAGKVDAGANGLTWKAGNIGTEITAGTLTIGNSGATAISKNVTAAKIDATGKEVSQSAGTITLTGTDAFTASKFTQTGGAISADKLNAEVAQSAGTVTANEITGTLTQSGNGTINATTLSGTVTQNGGTIKGLNGSALTISKKIDTQKGTIDVGSQTITLSEGGTLGGTITAGKIDATGKDVSQSAGTITLTGTDAFWASKFTQSGGSISADKLNAAVEQTAGTISANEITGALEQSGSGTISAATLAGNVTQSESGTISATTLSGTVTQNGGTIKGLNGSSLTISKKIDTQKGTIDVGSQTITLSEGGTLGGTITAGKIAASGKDVSQSAGTITLTGTDAFTASKFTQSGGSISADKLNAAVEQTAGTISANEITGALVQNGGTISDRGGNGLKLDQSPETQNGWINVSSLEFVAGNDYELTGDNNIGTLAGAADAVSVNNANNSITLNGLITDSLSIVKAGAVSDGNTANVLGDLTLGSADSKVGSVVLDNTEATVKGVAASGDIGLVVGEGNITIDGKISGGNVTLAAAAGKDLTVASEVSASGDMVLKADDGAVSASGATLDAGDSMVLQGKSVAVANSTLNAKTGIGMAADVDTLSIGGNSQVNAPSVVLNSKGDMTIADGVTMKTSSSETENEAALAIYTDGKLQMDVAGGSVTKNISIEKDSTEAPVIKNDDKVKLDKLVYNTETTDDIAITFTGSELSLQSKGNLTVNANGDVKIVDVTGEPRTVEANDVISGTQKQVTVGTPAAEGLSTADGKNVTLIGDGGVTVAGTVKGGNVEISGTSVSQTSGSIEAAGTLNLTATSGDISQEGGKISATGTTTLTAENGNITLTQEENDFSTVTAKAKGVSINDANDIILGKVEATAGAIAVKVAGALENAVAIEASGDVKLKGASFTGTGAITSKDGDGTGHDVTITTTDAESATTIKAAIDAKNITVESAGALENTVAIEASGDVTLKGASFTGTAAITSKSKAGDVTITTTDAEKATTINGEVNGKNVSVKSAGALNNNAAIDATGDVTLKGSSYTGSEGATINGGTVSIDTAGALANNASITATGDVKLNGSSYTGSEAATINGGTVSVNTTGALENNASITATGDVKLKGASYDGTGAITSKDGDENGHDVLIETTTGAATIGAAVNGKNVTVKSAGAVEENAVVNANGGDKVVLAGGDITVADGAGAFNANNAIYDAGDKGSVTFVNAPKVSAAEGKRNLGIRGTEVNVDYSGIEAGALVVETTTEEGNITLASGKPTGVNTLAIKAAGDVDITSNSDVIFGIDGEGNMFTAGKVEATTVTADGTSTTTLEASGLDAAGDLKVTATDNANIKMSGAGAGGAVTLTADGGNIDVGTVEAKNGNATLAATDIKTTSIKATGDVSATATTGDVKVGVGDVGGDVTAGGAVTLTAANDVATKTTTAGGATTVNSATVSGGTYNGGTVDINATGAANITVNATGAATVDAASTTGGQIAGGTVEVNVAGGMANDINATAGNATVNAATIANNTMAAAGDLVANATAGDIATGTVNANGGAALTAANAVNVAVAATAGGALVADGATVDGVYNGGTVDINATGAANITVNATGAATVDAAGTTGGQIAGGTVEVNVAGDIANDIQAGGQATITSGSINNNAIDAGNLVLAVGGAVNTGDINVDGAATGNTGDLTFNQFTAGNIDMDTGAVAGGGTIASGDIALRAGGNVGGGEGNTVTLDMGNGGTLNELTGNNIYVDFPLANGVINLGTVNAGGDLYVSAPNIGNGTNNGGGFNDANGAAANLVGQNITMDVGGRVGTLADPLEATVNGGTFTVGRGALGIDGTAPSFVHINLASANDIEFLGDTSAGLLIVNGLIAGGNPKLVRAMNRAYNFTVNTPELKSAQGIFGSPAFIHTKMEVAETRSMGMLDMLSISGLDFGGTFDDVMLEADALAEWTPPVDLGYNSQLASKIRSIEEASRAAQKDIHVMRSENDNQGQGENANQGQ